MLLRWVLASFAVSTSAAPRQLIIISLQAPVDISKPGMMLLNNLFGLIPCSVLVLTYQASAVCGGQFLCNGGGSRHLVCELLWLLKLQSFACSQEVPRWPSVVTHLSVGKWLLITASCVNGLAISYAVPQRCPCYSTRIFCLCFARLTSFHQTKISPKSHFALLVTPTLRQPVSPHCRFRPPYGQCCVPFSCTGFARAAARDCDYFYGSYQRE